VASQTAHEESIATLAKRSLIDPTEYNNIMTGYALAEDATIPPQKDRMTMIHYENRDTIMELVDEAQARLLHANLSRAHSTVCTHWGATVRTLDPSQWAMFLRSRIMLVPDELTKFCRKCGKEHRKEGHATHECSAQNTSTAKDTTASCTGLN